MPGTPPEAADSAAPEPDEPEELTRDQLCERWGVSRRTLTRRVKDGLPVHRTHGRSQYFLWPVAEAWAAERGLDGSTEKPSLDKALRLAEELRERKEAERLAQLERARAASQAKRPPKAKPEPKAEEPAKEEAPPAEDPSPGKASIAKATLTAKGLAAQKAQRELEREAALSGLGLGEQIRNAETLEDLKRAALAVAAADADGLITTARSRSLKAALSEARQVFSAYAAQPKEQAKALHLYQEEALKVAEAVDQIVSDERRELALQAVLDLLEEDLEQLPNTDPLEAT